MRTILETIDWKLRKERRQHVNAKAKGMKPKASFLMGKITALEELRNIVTNRQQSPENGEATDCSTATLNQHNNA